MKIAFRTLVSVLAVSSVAFAGTETVTNKASEATKPAMGAVNTATKAEPMTVKVVSVDNATKTVTVMHSSTGTDGKEMSKEMKLTWNEQTKLMWHGADKGTAATTTDLKPGAMVQVEVAKDNANLATAIHIMPATADAAKPATTGTTK